MRFGDRLMMVRPSSRGRRPVAALWTSREAFLTMLWLKIHPQLEEVKESERLGDKRRREHWQVQTTLWD